MTSNFNLMLVQRLRALVGLRSSPANPASGAANVATATLVTGSRLDSGKLSTGKAGFNEQKLLPSTGLLEQLLDEYGLKHFIDDDGDLAVRWEQCSMYFFHYGQNREVLQARMYLNRRFAVEARSGVALALDDWNRTKLFPKAYTVLPDDGLVGICGEQCHDFEVGATREQMKYTVGVWIDTLLRFAEWVDEHVWLENN